MHATATNRGLRPKAAFLTQTVSLDDGTTVKFEIWCAACYHATKLVLILHVRDTAGQERYKVR